MYKVTVTGRAGKPNFDPIACDLSYLSLRDELRKDGITVSKNIEELGPRGFNFHILKGEPTDKLKQRVDLWGNAKYEELAKQAD